MSDKDKKPSDKRIDEHKEQQRKDYERSVDYSEKMQSPEPWPEPPDDKNKKEQ